MVGKDLGVGDLVWAKTKGCLMWPGRIEKPLLHHPFKLDSKAAHFVFFFGSECYSWVLDEYIVPHTPRMQNAIDAITLCVKSPKKDSLEVKEQSDSEEVEKSTPTTTEQKSAKIQHKAPVLRKYRAVKKTPMEFPADSSPKHSSPKSRKVDSDDDDDDDDDDEVYDEEVLDDDDDDDSIMLDSAPLSFLNALQSFNEDPPMPQTSGMPTVSEDMDTPTTSREFISASIKKIGFIGLGMIGQRLVKNLLDAGHDVTVWNRTAEKCEPLVKAGATQGLYPSDVIARCDITFSCVSDPDAVKMVVFGNHGVLQGLDGCVEGSKGYVELTSIDPTTSKDIAKAISKAGGRYLVAPIRGSMQLAKERFLFILAAGDLILFRESESCLSAFSENAYFISCNAVICSKISLILSMLLSTTYGALAEALALVDRCKCSKPDFLEILELGWRIPLLDVGKEMQQRNFFSKTALKYQVKDLSMALSLARQHDQPLLTTCAAYELFKSDMYCGGLQ